jgi:hypothetical protein
LNELLYSMDVGGVIEVRDGFITRNRVFPSPARPPRRTEVGSIR